MSIYPPSCLFKASLPPEAVFAHADVLILGDELESLVTAISCHALGLKVLILRQSYARQLGGLSTRGGLSYMDLTPTLLSPVFAKLIDEAGLKRVALEGETASGVLWHTLSEAGSGIQLMSGVQPVPIVQTPAHPENPHTLIGVQDATTGRNYTATTVIDSTPDACLIRQLPNICHGLGLGGLFGKEPYLDALGVTPVFRIANLSPEGLQAVEATCRALPHMLPLLERHLPWLTPAERRTLLKRPSYKGVDYLDILNPIIGVAYHAFRYGQDTSLAYQEAPYWIDGGNVSILNDGTLCFNGLVGRLSPIEAQLEASTTEAPLSVDWLDELAQVEAFLQTVSNNPLVKVLPPSQLYIRQTARVQTLAPLTAQQLYQGGCSEAEAVGSFSYWLDFRGIHPWQAYPDLHPLPKPVFRVGLKPHVFCPTLQGYGNVAVLGRSSGYSPLAQGACRIVQYNALVGEALAAACAVRQTQPSLPLAHIPIHAIREQQAQLSAWAGRPLSPILTEAEMPTVDPRLLAHPLLQADARFASTPTPTFLEPNQ